MVMKDMFDYEIIYSSRKTLALQITAEGRVIVRAPVECPRSVIKSFVQQKERWGKTHLARLQERT